MVFTRLNLLFFPKVDLITFAVFGYIENLFGIILLFNEKKREVKLSKYSQQRIEIMRAKQA